MNRKALQKLSYGVYLVTTACDGKQYGCVANSAMQITSAPAQIAVSINHDNATHDQIAQSGKFALSILATDTDPALIGGFGYRSSRDADKFAGIPCAEHDGMPVPDGLDHLPAGKNHDRRNTHHFSGRGDRLRTEPC